MDIVRTRICQNPECNKEFVIGYNQRNAKYCCDECAKAIRKVQKKAYRNKIKNAVQSERTPRPNLPYSGTEPVNVQGRDWRTIVKICEQHKVSYGYAVAMHLID